MAHAEAARYAPRPVGLKRKPLRADAGRVRKAEYRKLNVARPRHYRCRCTRWHCQQRWVLRKHPNLYMRGPKRCHCGAPLRVDWQRTLGRESRRHVCHCGAAHYPHRRGWCQGLQ